MNLKERRHGGKHDFISVVVLVPLDLNPTEKGPDVQI